MFHCVPHLCPVRCLYSLSVFVSATFPYCMAAGAETVLADIIIFYFSIGKDRAIILQAYENNYPMNAVTHQVSPEPKMMAQNSLHPEISGDFFHPLRLSHMEGTSLITVPAGNTDGCLCLQLAVMGCSHRVPGSCQIVVLIEQPHI